MAEKSGELEGTKAIVAEIESDDDALERRTGNYSLSETDDHDIEVEESETGDAQQIREQIEETRSQLSETIDAIQDKLSVANITEQVKDQVSEQIGTAVESAKDALLDKTNAFAKGIGRSLADIGNSSLAKTARENPWLTSVVGMGIGAVLVSVFFGGGQKRKKKFTSDRYRDFDEDKYTRQKRQKFNSEEVVEFKYQTARNNANEAADESDKNSAGVFAGIGSVADSTYQGIGNAAGKTHQSVGRASTFAYQKAGNLGEEMKKSYEQYIEENPLVVGAVAFAVGAAIGYAVPSTKIENQYLGEVRDNVLEKAQASAQDAIGTVKQTVSEAQQMIVDEVKSQTAS